MRKSPANLPQRPTLAHQLGEALPDLGLALACLVTWIAPDWLGSLDALAIFAPAFLVELPLALLIGTAGVRRIADKEMARARKITWIVVFGVVLAVPTAALCGRGGLEALAWLAAMRIGMLLWRGVDTSPAVPGYWITYTQGEDGATSMDLGGGTRMGVRSSVARGKAKARSWRVQGGVDEFVAALSIPTWLGAVIINLMVHVPANGIDAAAVAASAWSRTPLAGMMSAPRALVLGLIFFFARALLRIDLTRPEPIADIAQDPELQEIIRKVEGKKNSPRKK